VIWPSVSSWFPRRNEVWSCIKATILTYSPNQSMESRWATPFENSPVISQRTWVWAIREPEVWSRLVLESHRDHPADGITELSDLQVNRRRKHYSYSQSMISFAKCALEISSSCYRFVRAQIPTLPHFDCMFQHRSQNPISDPEDLTKIQPSCWPFPLRVGRFGSLCLPDSQTALFRCASPSSCRLQNNFTHSAKGRRIAQLLFSVAGCCQYHWRFMEIRVTLDCYGFCFGSWMFINSSPIPAEFGSEREENVGRRWRCHFWQSFTILAYPLEKDLEQDSRSPHIGYQTKIQCPSFRLGTAGPGGTKWVWQNSKIINPRNISVIPRYPSRDYWSSGWRIGLMNQIRFWELDEMYLILCIWRNQFDVAVWTDWTWRSRFDEWAIKHYLHMLTQSQNRLISPITRVFQSIASILWEWFVLKNARFWIVIQDSSWIAAALSWKCGVGRHLHRFDTKKKRI